MRKMIDAFSEEGDRIINEVDKQVRAELGLIGVSVDDMSKEDFRRYYEAVTSRVENAGIDFTDVLRLAVKRMAKTLRECGEDVPAEVLQRMKQFEDMVRRQEH